MRKAVLALSAVMLLSGCGYNTIQELDEQAAAARANIEAELIRRNDLIPNLVATVDEAASFEQETFTQVAEARAGVGRARQQVTEALGEDATVEELAAANNALQRNLSTFLNIAVEAYPTLNANQSFIGLQDELSATENRLAVARRDYNEAVRQYNTYVRKFPQLLTAKVIGAEAKDPIEAPEGMDTPPSVEFDRGE